MKLKLSAYLEPSLNKKRCANQFLFHLKKKKKLAVGSKFPFLPQTVCLLKNIESAAAARVVQTYTHALLSLSISCQFSTTLRSIQSASRTGRQSVGCARRGNSWPPLSTHWGYLVWHQLPATGVSLPNAACGRKNGKTEPREWGERRDRPRKLLLQKVRCDRPLAECP